MEKTDAPRLGAERDLLLETAGRMVAVEFAIKIIMETHPEREKLAERWRQAVTVFVDAAMEHPLYMSNQDYRNGLNGQLQRLAAMLPTTL